MAKIIQFVPTPNPNAIKCVLDAPIVSAPEPRSFLSPRDAAPGTLAEALFACPGIRNLLMHRDWMTIGREPSASWAPIKRHVAKVLEQAAPQ